MKKIFFIFIAIILLSAPLISSAEVLRPENVDEEGNPYDVEFDEAEGDQVYDAFDMHEVDDPCRNGEEANWQREGDIGQAARDNAVSENYDEFSDMIKNEAEETYNSGRGR